MILLKWDTYYLPEKDSIPEGSQRSCTVEAENNNLSFSRWWNECDETTSSKQMLRSVYVLFRNRIYLLALLHNKVKRALGKNPSEERKNRIIATMNLNAYLKPKTSTHESFMITPGFPLKFIKSGDHIIFTFSIKDKTPEINFFSKECTSDMFIHADISSLLLKRPQSFPKNWTGEMIIPCAGYYTIRENIERFLKNASKNILEIRSNVTKVHVDLPTDEVFTCLDMVL